MKTALASLLRLTAGIVLILIGIAGLFIPILQGWIFIVAGIAVVNPQLGAKIKVWLTDRAEWIKVYALNVKNSFLSFARSFLS